MFFFYDNTKRYDMGMTLVNQKAKADFTRDKTSSNGSVKDYIKKSFDEFSDQCKNSINNSKYIDSETIKISKNSITFTLVSEKELASPGKSLKQLSKMLLEDPYFEKLKVNGKLFKTYATVEVADEENGKTQSIDVANIITDVDLVKALVDYLVEPQHPYTPERHAKRAAVDKMKVLAIQSGLLEYKGE